MDRSKVIKYVVLAVILFGITWLVLGSIEKILETNEAYEHPATFTRINSNVKKLVKKKSVSTSNTYITVASGSIDLPDGTHVSGTGISVGKKEEKKEETTENTNTTTTTTEKSTPVFKPVQDYLYLGKSVNTGDIYGTFETSFLFGTRLQLGYGTDLSGDILARSKVIVAIGIPL